jgi:Ferritin-like domain
VTASRRDLLREAGALAAGALAAGALGAEPALAATPSDADALGRLLALERRLAAAYQGALARDAIDPELGRLLLSHEREHVRGLEQALRRRGARDAAPAPAARAEFGNRRAFARSALELERTAVDTYREVLTSFHDDTLLQPLGSIMACGAQHEVALRQVLGEHLLQRN